MLPRVPDFMRLAERVLRWQRSLSRAKGQLLRAWLEYQMARLDLYQAVGLPLP